MTRFLIFLVFFAGLGRQVAYVDLTAPPRTSPARGRLGPVSIGGGGPPLRGYRDPRTLPVSVKLTRLASVVVTGRRFPQVKDSVEVVVTNTGDNEIVLPVGDDPELTLAPYATDRRDLLFAVVVKNNGVPLMASHVGASVAVANAGQPETVAHLAPGDSVTYKLPFDQSRADEARKLIDGAGLRLAVEVQFYGIETGPDGTEKHGGVGDLIYSENTLAWPPEGASVEAGAGIVNEKK